MTPRFSVIMATKNRQDWIRRAADSVLEQNYDHWELVIADGSDDPGQTAAALPDDPRIHLIVQQNTGPAEGFQIALDHAQGEIVTPLADDDRMASNALSYVELQLGEKHPGAKWGYGVTVVQGPGGDEHYRLGEPFDLNRLRQTFYLGGAVYWRRELSDELGGFDTAYDGAADWKLYLNFAEHYEPVFWRRVLYLYTDHPLTDSNVNRERQLEAAARIARG